MICANPDRVVEHGGRLIYCGGALADLYEAQGGRILMAGKPYRPIYDEALRMAEAESAAPLDRAKVLAIGDSVRTDAIGAANAGIDLFFITGSVHAGDFGHQGAPDPAAVAAKTRIWRAAHEREIVNMLTISLMQAAKRRHPEPAGEGPQPTKLLRRLCSWVGGF